MTIEIKTFQPAKDDEKVIEALGAGLIEPSHGAPTAQAKLSPPVRLRLTLSGDLTLVKGLGVEVRVHPKPCFPWSETRSFISLVNAQGGEEALVEDLERDLDVVSYQALSRCLQATHFVLEIRSVISIVEDYELRLWRAETNLGPRSFQTKLDEWPKALPEGSFIIQDLSGDLYKLPALKHLDAKSQKLLWSYVD